MLKEQAMRGDEHVHTVPGTGELITARLRLRPWTRADVDAALDIFGRPEVARWLAPALAPAIDRAAMEAVLERWISEHDQTGLPLGRWAIEKYGGGEVGGGVSVLAL